MLFAVAGLVLLLIALSWGIQALWALRLALHYPPGKPPADPPDEQWPLATIVLPLRGADPVLAEGLRHLCQQDYPHYEIRIVVDSDEDSTWPIIRQVMAEFPQTRITTRVLTDRLETCSLKVSAILQGIADLEPDCGVVAFIDADVVAPPHWLRELVRPFVENPKLAAASGIRWYHTHSCAWGSLVRGLWGAGAACQMYSLPILWGGSLAYRANVLRDPELQKLWAHSFVEDTSVVGFLQQRGLPMKMLPRLTMINPESINLSSCYRFIRRQLVCMRLHHPSWNFILFMTLGMALTPLLSTAVAGWAWMAEVEWLMWTMLGVQLGAILAAGFPMVYIDGYFYYTAPEDKPLATLRWKHIPVIPITVLVQLLATLEACWTRQIDWRGIHYTLDDQGGIHRTNDAPYTETPQVEEHAESIV